MRYYGCKASFLLILPALLLSSCMVGPNYHRPKAPDTKTPFYTDGRPFKKTVSTRSMGQAGGTQRFLLRKDLPGQWWKLFHSPKINHFIEEGLANNPNMAAAKAALISAQETLNAQIGSTMLPAVSASFTGQRQKINDNASGFNTGLSIFNLFNTTVSVTYTLYLFGGLRRQIEAAQAQVDFEEYQLEATYLALTSNIVTTAITIASLKDRIVSTQDQIKLQRQQLSLMQKQFDLGGIAEGTLLTQESFVAQTEATLPPLQQQLAQNKHALAVLMGRTPSEETELDFKLDEIHLPKNIPVSVPSALVKQRPDIRSAEATLHEASANVGVAVANLYPQVNLTPYYGWQTLVMSQLFSSHSNIWALGGSITEPIFNGESLMARKRVAIANYQNANALYRQTILTAFQNVADSLRALQHDAQALKATRRSEVAAQKALNLSQDQYKLGGVSYLTVLIAQQQFHTTQISRIIAQTNRYTDTVALFQSLGGGWWNRPCLDCNRALTNNVKQYQDF